MSATALHTEKELFALIATGDEAAFEKIFHTYNAKLLPFVTSITKNKEATEEIMQELFLKVWLKRDTLPTIEHPAAWLVRLSSNLALSYIQRQAVHERVVSNLSNLPAPAANTMEADIDVKKIQQHITHAVNSLPEKRQEVYRLSREEGLSRKQIAEMLSVSESTVKNQLSSALKSIQEYLQKHYGIYLPLVLLTTLV
jgi:RNA polymerase sigma-70 factor (family 1)